MCVNVNKFLLVAIQCIKWILGKAFVCFYLVTFLKRWFFFLIFPYDFTINCVIICFVIVLLFLFVISIFFWFIKRTSVWNQGQLFLFCPRAGHMTSVMWHIRWTHGLQCGHVTLTDFRAAVKEDAVSFLERKKSVCFWCSI